jgi:hypothetical protein
LNRISLKYGPSSDPIDEGTDALTDGAVIIKVSDNVPETVNITSRHSALVFFMSFPQTDRVSEIYLSISV